MTDFRISKLVLAMQLNGFICLSYTPVRDKILFIKVGRLINILYLYR